MPFVRWLDPPMQVYRHSLEDRSCAVVVVALFGTEVLRVKNPARVLDGCAIGKAMVLAAIRSEVFGHGRILSTQCGAREARV